MKTALEWFNEEINKLNVGTDARVFIVKLFVQAKEMENQQQEQDKKLYSEEEVYDLFSEWFLYKSGAILVDEDEIPNGVLSFNKWFEQFKKK